MEKMILKIRYVLSLLVFMWYSGVQATEPVFYPRPVVVKTNKQAQENLKAKEMLDDAIWYEGFDGGLPGSWQSVDLSGYVGFVHTYSGPQGSYSQGVPGINSSSASNGFMILDSDLASEHNPGGLTDAYIQSPPIDLSGHPHVMLSFQHFFRYCCSFQGTQLLVEVSNDGEQWVSFDVKNGVWPNNLSQNAIHQLVNISEVAAGHEQVWIRFRKIGASHYFWMIDDVSINTYTANDLELFAISYGGYTMVPGGQQQAVAFGGMIRNLGGNTQTGVSLSASINIHLFHGESQVIPQLASGHSVSLETATQFTFPGKGQYHIAFEAIQNQADTEPANNTSEGRVLITDSIYARDGGIYQGDGIRAEAGGAFITGNIFQMLSDVTATSVSVALHEETQAGALFNVQVYKKEGTGFQLLAQTDGYVVSQDDIPFRTGETASWVTLSLDGEGLLLEGEADYLVAVNYAGGADPLVVSSEVPRGLPNQGAFTNIGGLWQTESQIPMIRLNLGNNLAECVPFYEIITTEAYCGNEDGQATVIPLTGFAPYTFLWNTDPGQGGPTAEGLGVGQVLVEVWDSSGCYDSLYVDIASLNLEMDFEAQASACGAPNGEATIIPLAGFAPYTFEWPVETGGEGATATGLLPGTYLVSVTDSIGCEGQVEVIIEENDFLLVEAQVQNPICVSNNGSIHLQPEGGSEPFVYTWLEFPELEGNLAENLAEGSYHVMIIDQSGCESELEFDLEFEEIELEIESNVVAETCELNNASILLQVDGATAPINYSWSNGASSPSLEDIGEGEYTVLIVDAYGCEAEMTFSITNIGQMPRVSSFTSNSPGCGQSGGTALIIPENPEENLVYEWSTGETTPNIENVPAGLYYVSIVNPSENCVLEYPVLINDAGAPVVSGVVSPILCHGDANGAITVTATGGLNPQYAWIHGPEGQTVADLGPGTYIVTVSDGSCFTSKKFDLTQPDYLRLQYNFDQVLCFGETTTINVSPLGGTSPYSFYWNTGQTGELMEQVEGGEYWVQVIDFHECAYKEYFTVNDPEEIVVEAELVIPDAGESNGSIHLTVMGGTGALSYAWNTGATTPFLANIPRGTYTVIIRDENDCSEIQSYNLSPAGVEEITDLPLSLYPNPAGDQVWLQAQGNLGEKVEVLLFDLNGRMIRQVYSGPMYAGDRVQMDLSGIAQGMYLLNLRGTNVNSMLKLLKR
ncbi:MAG: T9SS type A sorting domain-containing protein [Bacteroidales bacterium]|nr:T9SS type A sorting domain-containing protein [Bacteroidales bacterium]